MLRYVPCNKLVTINHLLFRALGKKRMVIKHLTNEILSAKTLNRNMPFGVYSVSVYVRFRGSFGLCGYQYILLLIRI